MGHRLSVITTRTGDDGTTGLADGSRCAKNSIRIIALGEVDELNSLIGWLITESLPEEVSSDLLTVQHHLFDLGAEISAPNHAKLTEAHLDFLDKRFAFYHTHLSSLREFILPGGSRASAHTHVARTICRRAERTLITLDQQEGINKLARQYVNRLSDLFFVMARYLNKCEGKEDVYWV